MANITRKEVLNKVIASNNTVLNLNTEEVEVLNKILKSFEKKSTGENKKSIEENTALVEELVEQMEEGKSYKAAELGRLLDLSPQKITGLSKKDYFLERIAVGKDEKEATVYTLKAEELA